MTVEAARVVHVDHAPYDVYIGRAAPRRRLRASPWANPFIVSEYGRDEAIRLYRERLLGHPVLLQALCDLRGKVLGCWCKTPAAPDTPCHGDVLVELAALPDEELLALARAAEAAVER